MSQASRSRVLGFGLVGLILETIISHPALATDKVSLFKVVTAKDEIVIGLTDDELAKYEGRNAGGIAKALKTEGTLSVWRYAMRKAGSGDLEQAPTGKIGLMANDALRVEPYTSPVKVVPIDETK
ncbi:hypothetical protein JQ557_11390 [Bradyrhizobium sp. U87765 SZCCT0131]|uniref:hypothetical protein n=1 Tax=unclassified Bradyrhizobium TaxID=2631580 RepID=UPI001BAAE93B|nr:MULTISPECIES: hypothetical protein [unclassified Bradyrhizobium]MBR1218596.1 hypothetical protein [Bradyrhizobium sp. U87765 SZCCT0131]MBR1265645.1 hypothetical protein [Bradyrhizobium sp. U87765 SZCCT0134]MBR1304094.1 hypothetical protein [Bradyrhizobium sp. U87765 SZCCT0110]MBR1319700.1 hypothetical protein [Bradyrhizobium sp. U87765 SZCCT0109]MBR1348025.1 hypothetical protein [Bradyrhizobium sp. U87765 SZCCT0048]